MVTCTLGEEGEVLVEELAHLAPDNDDKLGQYRIGELEKAMAALGVTDYRFLGGPGRYRDTGMAYNPAGLATAPPTYAPTPSGQPTSPRPPTTSSRSSARCAPRSW